jgi:hypothetical protein
MNWRECFGTAKGVDVDAEYLLTDETVQIVLCIIPASPPAGAGIDLLLFPISMSPSRHHTPWVEWVLLLQWVAGFVHHPPCHPSSHLLPIQWERSFVVQAQQLQSYSSLFSPTEGEEWGSRLMYLAKGSPQLLSVWLVMIITTWDQHRCLYKSLMTFSTSQ